jgi:hypothetical protein
MALIISYTKHSYTFSPRHIHITDSFEGVHSLDDAQRAGEFFALSTTRDLLPVAAIGNVRFPTTDGPMRYKLQAAMDVHIASLEPKHS